MLHGFTFGIGFFTSIYVFIVIIIVAKRLAYGKVCAPAKAWQDYLSEITAIGAYEEARMISDLITDKKSDDEIKTPKGYKVTVDKDLIIDEGDDSNISKIRFKKRYKIKKISA